jgi:hypothetical protein
MNHLALLIITSIVSEEEGGLLNIYVAKNRLVLKSL